MKIVLFRLAPLALLALGIAKGASALPSYQVEFNLDQPLTNVFVSAHEWNGEVYAWDLFPIALGDVGVGTHVYNLGSHDVVSWAVFANHDLFGVGAGINSSIPPPDGLPFETVFPGFSEATVGANIGTLYSGGAYNTPQAYYLFNWVLTCEDTLKTDFATDSLTMYGWTNGVNIGTASFGPVPEPASLAALALGVGALFIRKLRKS